MQVVRIGKTVVEHDRVELLSLRRLRDGGGPIAGFRYGITDIRERFGQRPPNQRLVVHNEHTRSRGIFLCHWGHFHLMRGAGASWGDLYFKKRSRTIDDPRSVWL